MKKVRVITAEEAALLVKDGDTVTTGGFVSCACPEALTRALENRFVETGHPRDLTLFFAAGQGHRDGTGGDHFGHEGMCKWAATGIAPPSWASWLWPTSWRPTTCPRASSPICTGTLPPTTSAPSPMWV